MTLGLTLLFLATLIGAGLQRISGMGLGLICAPILMLLFGPVQGIIIINVLATINAAASTATQLHDVDWRSFSIIAPGLVLGAIPGALVVREVPSAPLLILVGVLLLIALAAVTWGKRFIRPIRSRRAGTLAGFVGGFVNALAGAAGPSITVYAQAARWEQRAYAATLQPLFVVAGTGSFLMKTLLGAGSVMSVNPVVWLVGVVGMALGLVVGLRVAPRVSATAGRSVALSLAVIGGLIAVIRGALGVFA